MRYVLILAFLLGATAVYAYIKYPAYFKNALDQATAHFAHATTTANTENDAASTNAAPVSRPLSDPKAEAAWSQDYVNDLNALGAEITLETTAMEKPGGDMSQGSWDAHNAKIEDYQKMSEAATHPLGESNVLLMRRDQLFMARHFPDHMLRYHQLLQKLEASPLPTIAAAARKDDAPVELKCTTVDGSAFDLASLRGKVVIVHFWSAGCKPSEADAPGLVAAYSQFHDRGLEILGISLDSNKEILLSVMKQDGITWPQYFDGKSTDSELVKQYRISAIPEMWLIGKDGRLLSTDPRADLAGQIESALAASQEITSSPVPASTVSTAALPNADSSVATNEVTSTESPTSSNDVSTPDAPKPAASPGISPLQANWTWETLDGKTYQNVVVTKIEADTVTISHATGTAHIPMNLLPDDIRKKLNYDPIAAAAARAERDREAAHPYYRMTESAEAQAEAARMHWPVAWLSSFKEYILRPVPLQNEEADMTRQELDYLKDKAVIIFIDVNNEMNQTPTIVHHQFSQYDDGVFAGGANYHAPKIVFTSPDATQIFGRVAFAKMKDTGIPAIDEVLSSIPKDAGVSVSSDDSSSDSAPAPVPASSSSDATTPAAIATSPAPAPAPARAQTLVAARRHARARQLDLGNSRRQDLPECRRDQDRSQYRND